MFLDKPKKLELMMFAKSFDEKHQISRSPLASLHFLKCLL